MKSDFFKSISLLAFFAAFTAIMFACGSDNEPSAPERTPTESSSSAAPIMSSIVVTEISPIRFQAPSVSHNGDKTSFNFNGSATLDAWDTTANADSENDPFFTGMELTLAHVNDLGQNEQTPLQLTYAEQPFPTYSGIGLGELGVSINDPEKTQCGTFKLFVVLYATNDAADPKKFISVDSIEFVREPEYCVVEPDPVSSSSEPVSMVELRQFNGDMTTSNFKGFSFKTDAEVDAAEAQFQVSLCQDGQLTLVGLNGHKVAKYTNARDKNYYDDWSSFELPPAPAYIGNFRYNESALADSVEGFDVDAFWVIIGPAFNKDTGDDFYAVTLEKKDLIDGNGIVPLHIIYYKK